MIKAKTITNNIIESNYTQKAIFRVFIALILVLSVVYIYLIGSITFNVLARKSLENNIRSLGSRVSQLELDYLNSSNKIDKNYASSLGFVEIDNTIFATRAGASVAIR